MGCRPRMAGCSAGSCGHRRLVEEYQAAARVQTGQLEQETRMFPGDVALWRESHTTLTFQQWLIDNRRPREEAA
jgi:hypothetical protein